MTVNDPPNRPLIMVSAGEASGDQHAAHALKELKKRGVDFDAFGMGAGDLAEIGVDIKVDCRELAVIGLVEVLKNLPALYKRLFYLVEQIKQRKPDLIVLVDYPEFNLKLAWWVRKLNIPILFYISPQVWAWRSKRVHKIGKRIDHMAVIFPFEVPFYTNANIPVTYVGHPLIDSAVCEWDQSTAREKLSLPATNQLVALVPGSRNGELHRNLPVMLGAAKQLLQQRPNTEFVIPCAPTLEKTDIETMVQDSGLTITLIDGQICPVLRSADAAVTASGTATLETALMGTPMAIMYRVNELTYKIMSRMIQIDDIGLVNIVATRRVVQEFVQDDATPEAIAEEMNKILTDEPYRAQMKKDLLMVQETMGDGGASGKVATLIQQMLPSSTPV